MGDYFDIICEKHKAILRLWKAYDLISNLPMSWDTFATLELKPSYFKKIIKERPINSKEWLEKHKDCKLILGNSENFRDTYNYDDFLITDTQPPPSSNDSK